MYIGTLTLALVLAVFGALLLAIALSNQLAQPLLLLAEGVAQVARGDFSSKAVFKSRDELGGLTRSFAEMTDAALRRARARPQERRPGRRRARQPADDPRQPDRRRDRVRPRTARSTPSTRARRGSCKLPLSAYRGRRLDEVAGLGGFAQAVWQRFELHAESPEAGERDHWQDSFELQFATTADGRERDSITLLVRGAAMPQGARLMVFDDITELVSAQRVEAWSEVARRLAHEIKNPLTPIQLSAERLQQKLGGKLDGADQGMLERSVTTIVNQVQAMKTLVNEFRDYARLPASSFDALDLNALVVEVLGLYGTAQESGRLSAELAESLPAIVGDGTQLRQVIHNLVQNALDAVAEQADGRVRIVTEAAKNESGEVRAVRLVVVDNGPGFSEKVLKRAFEPYVTTKKKGTGLGLAVVKKIADEHGARVRIANLGAPPDAAGNAVPDSARGAQVSLSFSKLATTVRVAANEPVATSRGALRVHGHHSCRRRRTGDSSAAVGDPRRRRPHDRAGGERGAGARLPRAHPARPRPPRHLDARRRRHHAAEGMGLDRAADDAGDHDERPRHDRHGGRGDQVRRDGLPGEADHLAEAAARRRAGPGQAAVARAVGAQRGAPATTAASPSRRR